jgi:3-methyladenine DNA glycosylase AlkC
MEEMKSPEGQAFKLKHIFTYELLENYAARLRQCWKPFPEKAFLASVFDEKWEQAELKERMRHISTCLRAHLPGDYPKATAILLGSVEKLLEEQGEKMVFEHGFIPDFVERYGLADPDCSLPALEKITRWTSAEFAIRPFLLHYFDRVCRQMLDWSLHESAYVRRLSSEGFRPRLPWGMGIPVLKKDPAPILPVLENLKADPAETVRRSVANNLNDISKDHPSLALKIAQQWKGISGETDWIVRHACRGLLKKGDPTALGLFGFDATIAHVEVSQLSCDAVVPIGGVLAFSFLVKNKSAQAADLRLEYFIEYLTSTGKVSRKVFKIKELNAKSGEAEQFKRHQRFTDFTTRKHYPGMHRIGILVNGKEMAGRAFEVLR